MKPQALFQQMQREDSMFSAPQKSLIQKADETRNGSGESFFNKQEKKRVLGIKPMGKWDREPTKIKGREDFKLRKADENAKANIPISKRQETQKAKKGSLSYHQKNPTAEPFAKKPKMIPLSKLIAKDEKDKKRVARLESRLKYPWEK